MPIVPMREILADAKNKGYAAGSYNAYDLTTVRGILQAAEEEGAPVILAHAPVHFKYTSLESAANIMVFEASRSRVPVAILLDHGYEVETCLQAMELGFNAVMMDASRLPLEENARLVKEVAAEAAKRGCDVEGEIGYVSRPLSGKDEGEDDDSIIDDTSLYTSPEDALRFMELSGADALAVAFGTAHGVYLKKPKLDIGRLEAIRSRVSVPLVMHGGSGLSAEDFHQAVAGGIRKVNYYTGMAIAAGARIRETVCNNTGNVFYHQVMMDTIEAVKTDVGTSMRLFGCSGQV